MDAQFHTGIQGDIHWSIYTTSCSPACMCFSNQPVQLSHHTFTPPAMLGFRNPDRGMSVTTPWLCFLYSRSRWLVLETCWETPPLLLLIVFASLHRQAAELQILTLNNTTCTTVNYFTLKMGKPHKTWRPKQEHNQGAGVHFMYLIIYFFDVLALQFTVCCTACETLGGKLVIPILRVD